MVLRCINISPQCHLKQNPQHLGLVSDLCVSGLVHIPVIGSLLRQPCARYTSLLCAHF